MNCHHVLFSYSERRRSGQLVATCSRRLTKKSQLIEGHTEGREEFDEEGAEILQVGRIAGEPGDFRLPGAREKHAGGDLKVVVTAAVGAVRNPAQRVDHVFIETGEETEAMLAWKRKAPLAAELGTGMLRALPPNTGLRS